MNFTNPNENRNAGADLSADRVADEDAATDSGFMHRMGVALDGAYRVGIIETASFFGLAVDAVNHAPRIINILPGDQGIGAFSDDPFLGSDYIRRNLTAGYEGYNDTIGYTPPEATDTVDSILYHGTGFLTGAALTGGGASLASRASYADDLLINGNNAASPGLLSRSFNYMSPNGARAVYISEAPAAERLSLLASRGEEATPYMQRIVRDIRAGRTPITSDAIDGLRNGGRMPASVMKGLDTAQGMLRADGSMGRWLSYRFGSEARGDILSASLPTIPTASLQGASRLTFGTLDAATSPFRVDRLVTPGTSYFGGVARTALPTSAIYVGDELAFDGAGRDLAFGLYESGTDAVGYAGEHIGELGEDGTPLGTAANLTSTALTWGSDLAASGAGHVNMGLDFALSAANPFDDEATPDPDPETVVAAAEDGPDGEVVNASATGPAARNGDGENSIMGFFNDVAEDIGIDFNNMDGVNYAQTAIAGLAAYTAFIEGNYMGGVIMGVMAYGLRPAMKFLDDWAESQGIDLVPDQWHTPESTNAYGGLSL